MQMCFVYFIMAFSPTVTDMMLERNPVDEMMKAFKLFDDDESGKISLRNMRRVARYSTVFNLFNE